MTHSAAHAADLLIDSAKNGARGERTQKAARRNNVVGEGRDPRTHCWSRDMRMRLLLPVHHPVNHKL